MKGIVKFMHETIFDEFFSEMIMIEKKPLKICLCLLENSKTRLMKRYHGTFLFN